MPIHRTSDEYWQWGKHGKKYKSRKGAERQAAAAHANGYKGMRKSLIGRIQRITKATNEELGIPNEDDQRNYWESQPSNADEGYDEVIARLKSKGMTDSEIMREFKIYREIHESFKEPENEYVDESFEYEPIIGGDSLPHSYGQKVTANKFVVDPPQNIQNMRKALPDRIAQFINAQKKEKKVDNKPRLPYNDSPLVQMMQKQGKYLQEHSNRKEIADILGPHQISRRMGEINPHPAPPMGFGQNTTDADHLVPYRVPFDKTGVFKYRGKIYDKKHMTPDELSKLERLINGN